MFLGHIIQAVISADNDSLRITLRIYLVEKGNRHLLNASNVRTQEYSMPRLEGEKGVMNCLIIPLAKCQKNPCQVPMSILKVSPFYMVPDPSCILVLMLPKLGLTVLTESKLTPS